MISLRTLLFICNSDMCSWPSTAWYQIWSISLHLPSSSSSPFTHTGPSSTPSLTLKWKMCAFSLTGSVRFQSSHPPINKCLDSLYHPVTQMPKEVKHRCSCSKATLDGAKPPPHSSVNRTWASFRGVLFCHSDVWIYFIMSSNGRNILNFIRR